MVRRFSNQAVETTLASSVGSGDTGMVVVDATGYPTAPFIVVVEPDTPSEEFMLVGQKSGNTFSTLGRGYDGSVDGPHNASSVVKHVAVASDFAEIWGHRHLSLEGSTPLDFGPPGNSFPSDVLAEGTADKPARSDHVHGRPSLSAGGGFGYVSVRQVQSFYTDGMALLWDVENLDTDGYHDPVVNNPRFTIPTGLGGFHLIMVHTNINLASDVNKEAHLSIRKNGITEIMRSPSTYTPDTVLGTILPLLLIGIAPLVEGDYVECLIYQNTGLTRPVGTEGSHMSLIRLSA